jgi:hypothetical protein
MFIASPMALRRMAGCMAAAVCLFWMAAGLRAESARMLLEVVRRVDDRILWSHPVQAGETFTIDYRHSSDHTPVHDVFRITPEGAFVLVEERFDWYGSGLEFHPSADIIFSGSQTRVRLDRPFARLPLRVGEVAGHTLTVHGTRLPLLSVAKARESVWIQTSQQPADRR